MPLPCQHLQVTVDQVPRAIELLQHLDTWHPEVLLQHNIQPQDYHGSLVFRSAIESIRGRYIAGSTRGRHELVAARLEVARSRDLITGYQYEGARRRYDFAVTMAESRRAAIEVKGGEGNSIQISERPIWADEFLLWCHLDGAVVNQPAHGASQIITRVLNQVTRDPQKRVDAIIIRDALCGSATRPCPKYPAGGSLPSLGVAPDIFLLPRRVPTPDDPDPPLHSQETLRLPFALLEAHDVPEASFAIHVFEIHIRLLERAGGRWRPEVRVWRLGREIQRPPITRRKAGARP